MALNFLVDAYFEAHQRYEGYRRAAYEEAHAVIWPRVCAEQRWSIGRLELREIDMAALNAWQSEWRACHPGSKFDGDFPWDSIFRQIRNTPRHFSVSMWADGSLCGMAAGMASRGTDNVTLRFVERRFGYNPLQGLVLPLAIESAEAYAVVLGRRRLKLRNPLQGVMRWYDENGFSLDKTIAGATYMSRGVDEDGSAED
jgi:hypothetical protein